MFSVYVLRSDASGRYYVGSTKDVPRRMAQHNSGMMPSTRGQGPWRLVYTEAFEALPEARGREMQLKSWKNPAYLRERLGIVE